MTVDSLDAIQNFFAQNGRLSTADPTVQLSMTPTMPPINEEDASLPKMTSTSLAIPAAHDPQVTVTSLDMMQAYHQRFGTLPRFDESILETESIIETTPTSPPPLPPVF